MKRGRKSVAELSVAAPLKAIPRPDAPYDLLDDEQICEWRGIVDALPADWFGRGSWPLLTQYVRCTIRCRRLAQLIHREEHGSEKAVDLDEYLKLLAAEREESRVLASLALKLRLAPVSLKRQDRTEAPHPGPLPWE